MRKERLKSFILGLLLANSLYLTTQIWFDKRLWPDGYNLFSSFRDTPVIGQLFGGPDQNSPAELAASYESLVHPYRIIVSSGDKHRLDNIVRSVFYQGEEEYAEIERTVSPVMSALFSQNATVSSISKDEWLSAFSGRSLTFDYGAVIDSSLISRVYSDRTPPALASIGSFREIAFAYSDKAALLYIRDGLSNSYYTVTAACDASSLPNTIETYSYKRPQKSLYAFESKLGQLEPAPNAQDSTMRLDPLVLLPGFELAPEQSEVLLINPFEGASIAEFSDNIVKAFGLQASNIRRSTSANGTVSYVENNATVDITPSGRIEYRAADPMRGIPAVTLYDKISTVLGIAKNQWNLLIPSKPLNLRLSFSTVTDSETTVIAMDYIFNNMPVISRPDTESSSRSHCIYAEFTGGKLTRFSMLMRSMEIQAGTTHVPPILEALNEIYNNASHQEAFLRVFNCYLITENENETRAAARWAASQVSYNVFSQN